MRDHDDADGKSAGEQGKEIAKMKTGAFPRRERNFRAGCSEADSTNDFDSAPIYCKLAAKCRAMNRLAIRTRPVQSIASLEIFPAVTICEATGAVSACPPRKQENGR